MRTRTASAGSSRVPLSIATEPVGRAILPGDGNRAGQRHEPGRAVQRAGQVVSQQTEVRHAAIITRLRNRNLITEP